MDFGIFIKMLLFGVMDVGIFVKMLVFGVDLELNALIGIEIGEIRSKCKILGWWMKKRKILVDVCSTDLIVLRITNI